MTGSIVTVGTSVLVRVTGEHPLVLGDWHRGTVTRVRVNGILTVDVPVGSVVRRVLAGPAQSVTDETGRIVEWRLP